MTQSQELVQPGCEESWCSMLHATKHFKKDGGCKPGEPHLPPLGHFHLRILSQQSIPPAVGRPHEFQLPKVPFTCPASCSPPCAGDVSTERPESAGREAHFFFCFALRSSKPSGFVYWTRSPIFPFIRPYSDSGSPLGSVASRVRVSAVRTKLEFCKASNHIRKEVEDGHVPSSHTP